MITEAGIAKRLQEIIVIGTEAHSLGYWLSRIGINYKGYTARLSRGMTIEEALTTPKGKILEKVMEKPQPKPKKAVKKLVRNGSSAGTWKWVEVDA